MQMGYDWIYKIDDVSIDEMKNFVNQLIATKNNVKDRKLSAGIILLVLFAILIVAFALYLHYRDEKNPNEVMGKRYYQPNVKYCQQ